MDRRDDNWTQELESALGVANIPTLLMVLVHLTGNTSWLSERYRPARAQGLDVNDSGGLPIEVQGEIRRATLEALVKWREGAPIAIERPESGLFETMLSIAVGEEVPRDQAAMMAEEIGFADRRSDWSTVAPEAAESLDVLVIGAGASGLCAAVRLKEAGVPFEVFEKDKGVGGTWFENAYPGAGVDSPGHLYSFTFDYCRSWGRYYPLRDEVKAYLQSLVPEFGLDDHLNLGCEVIELAYDQVDARWNVTIRTAEGELIRRTPRIVLSGVGQLNRPSWPQIDGLEQFSGRVIHSAQWPDDLDITGRRVAVIGSGASSVQLVPAIVDRVEHLTVFQRSPAWTAPNDQYLRETPEGLSFLVGQVPFYVGWYRFRLLWMFNDRLYSTLQVDPAWHGGGRSINAVNDQHRQYFAAYMQEQLEGRPDLLEKLLPDYPPFGKRILMDAGWFAALRRDHVELQTSGLLHVDGDEIVAQDGSRHPVDVIVLATGFHSRRFLWPLRVEGKSGATLRDLWGDDDASAYLGMSVPDFPNFFMLYGPNTNLGHGGSIVFHIECQVRYVMELLKEMTERGLVEVECRDDVHRRYVERVDDAHARMIWTYPGVRTWYRNGRGRVVSNSPWRLVDYWRMTASVNLDDYLNRSGR